MSAVMIDLLLIYVLNLNFLFAVSQTIDNGVD